MTRILRALGYAWSLPWGLCGLALEWLLAPDALARTGREMVVGGVTAEFFRARNWGGLTVGWSIFYWNVPTESIRLHEKRHVDQCLLFGPLMPILYLMCALVQGYRDNWFERDARAYADRKMLLK